MDGIIVAFDDHAQQGTVRTSDGRRYPFSLNDWRGRGLPGPDIVVCFDVREGRAIQVLNRPEKQRRATPRLAADEPAREANADTRPRTASGAIVAIVVALLGLFFDTFAPLLGLVAILFALLGLRQIHREPSRYKGRGFCWAAMGLAASQAGLSLMVEPATEPPAGPAQEVTVPGSSPDESHA